CRAGSKRSRPLWPKRRWPTVSPACRSTAMMSLPSMWPCRKRSSAPALARDQRSSSVSRTVCPSTPPQTTPPSIVRRRKSNSGRSATPLCAYKSICSTRSCSPRRTSRRLRPISTQKSITPGRRRRNRWPVWEMRSTSSTMSMPSCLPPWQSSARPSSSSWPGKRTPSMPALTMIQALNRALKQEMAKDDSVIVLGEDVGVDGGVFRVTEGLLKAFGEERVLDTPLAESGIVGFSIGLALYGLKPVCEIQFSGFSYLAMQQFESHAARLRWRSRGRYTVPLVARMPYGGGVRALEHHSESREAYYAHTPGLKMVLPSGPRTARALLVSAMRDPDPVIFFEPKLIYRAFREDVPEEEETLPIGKSRLVREGRDLTMIAYGAMLRRTVEAAEQLAREDGVEPEVIDLLTISP